MDQKKRVNWTTLETSFMLSIIRDKNILQLLDGKRYRNTDIFKVVEEELKIRGFMKTSAQIRTKWKTLKLNYFKTKRTNNTSGWCRVNCPFWDELDELLGHRPACSVEGGVDTSASPSSMESADIICNDSSIGMYIISAN